MESGAFEIHRCHAKWCRSDAYFRLEATRVYFHSFLFECIGEYTRKDENSRRIQDVPPPLVSSLSHCSLRIAHFSIGSNCCENQYLERDPSGLSCVGRSVWMVLDFARCRNQYRARCMQAAYRFRQTSTKNSREQCVRV